MLPFFCLEYFLSVNLFKMQSFKDLLGSHSFLILDGALATELERKGANLDDPLWSAKVLIETPALIKETHYEYLMAGADIITTATYQATFEGFNSKGFSKKESERLFSLAVQMAIEARAAYTSHQKRQILIAASIGPYGAFLADGSEYTGSYGISQKQLMEFHQDRLFYLAKERIDLLIFETIPSLMEIEAVLELLNNMSNPPVALMSFSCKNQNQLADGNLLSKAISVISQNAVIQAIGVNCIQPNLVESILSHLSQLTTLPLIAYPNNGDGWDAKQKCWIENHSMEVNKNSWLSWYNHGARIIGGCCRTRPEQIKRLSDFRDEICDIKE